MKTGKNTKGLCLVPITQDEAQAWINRVHRHHKAPVGSIFQVAFDADNRAIWIGKDGTWLNAATQSEIENGTTII